MMQNIELILQQEMQESVHDLKMNLQSFKKKQQKWTQEKQTLLKTITLLQQEVNKYKAINQNLLKKSKHKRTSSEQQTFIFNQTNISSYYPIVILKNNNWSHKTNLRSHLDSVRNVAFLQGNLISASEDSTLKVWQKQRLKLTLRSHLGPIYAMSCTANQVFTGGAEGVVRKWSASGLLRNNCAQFEADIHEQPIWDIITNSKKKILITSSADQSHKLLKWGDNQYTEMWTNTIVNDSPTALEWISQNKFISGFVNEERLGVFDVQTKCCLYSYQFQGKEKYFQTNKIQVHPKHKLLATANEDHYIRFFDVNSNKLIKEIAAHSDSVTSLLFSAEGFELISCGHDGNLRFWDLRKYKCVSDVAVSMRKYDENILCLAQNWEEGVICVGGADGLIKILHKEH